MTSRLPMPRSAFLHKDRDSIYPTKPLPSEMGPSDSNAQAPNPFLADCLKAFDHCNSSLYHAENALGDGVRDMPRLGKVLANELLYQVVTESTVRIYKSDVADEMESEIHELLERAKAGLKQLKKEENNLRVQLDSGSSRPSSRVSGTTTGTKLEQRRLQMLSKQKERVAQELAVLEAEVDALELATMEQ